MGNYIPYFYADVIAKVCFNSLRPGLNRRPFADDIFKCIFLNENEWILPMISLKFVPKVRINNIPALVQIMAWRRLGDKPLSELMMVGLLTHICITRPQWVKYNAGLADLYLSSLIGYMLVTVLVDTFSIFISKTVRVILQCSCGNIRQTQSDKLIPKDHQNVLYHNCKAVNSTGLWAFYIALLSEFNPLLTIM